MPARLTLIITEFCSRFVHEESMLSRCVRRNIIIRVLFGG